MLSNQGFGDFDRLRHRSPSPMASSNIMSNVSGTGLGGWNSLQQEVITLKLLTVASEFYIFKLSLYCLSKLLVSKNNRVYCLCKILRCSLVHSLSNHKMRFNCLKNQRGWLSEVR